MDPIIRDLLLNIFIITFFPLLLISFLGEKITLINIRIQKVMINLIGVIYVLLCMSIPVHFSNGFSFDFRQILVIFTLLLLGYKDSIPFMVITLLYLFFIGSEGFYTNIIIHLIIYMVVPPFKVIYLQMNLTKKILLTSSFSIFFSLTAFTLSKLFSSIPLIDENFIYYFVVLQMNGTIIMTIVIEYIRKNIELREQFIKGEKLKVVGELAASVSHEINNPLAVTSGFLQLLNDDSLTQAERKRYLALALSELERTKEVMEDYLILANPYQGHLEQVNLKEEIQLVVKNLQVYSAMIGVTINISCPPDFLFECERKKIQQVMINIAKNALEAMENGGTLLIELTREQKYFVILFQDNGIGMRPEQILKLGEPYFSAKTKGTGIGLMVVYRIIQSLEGIIQVTSKLNEGTDFIIKLPIRNK
jgi:two-component system sporulation sensor kinase B